MSLLPRPGAVGFPDRVRTRTSSESGLNAEPSRRFSADAMLGQEVAGMLVEGMSKVRGEVPRKVDDLPSKRNVIEGERSVAGWQTAKPFE